MPEQTADELLGQVQDTVVNGLTGILTMAGVAGGPLIAGGFAAEAIFRVVRLIKGIKAAEVQITAALDAQVRAQDIVREPIYVDIHDVTVWSFFRPDGPAKMFFPLLYTQLQPEIDEIHLSPVAASPKTLRTVRFAFNFLRPAYVTPGQDVRLLNRDLDELFGAWLQRDMPEYGRVAREAALLFPNDEFVLKDFAEQSGVYFLDKLKAEMEKHTTLLANAQAEMERTFKSLVFGALFGDNNFTNRTLKFAKDLRTQTLEAEIANLTAKKAVETDDTVKAALERKIAELTALKERIKALP